MKQGQFVAVFSKKHSEHTQISCSVDIIEFMHEGMSHTGPLTIQLILIPNYKDDVSLPRDHKIVIFHRDGAFSTDIKDLREMCERLSLYPEEEAYFKSIKDTIENMLQEDAA